MRRALCLLAAACLLSAVLLATAWTAEKAPEGTGIRFEKKSLLFSPNEGCTLADVNNDGQVDIIAGTHWFAAPDFVARPIRVIAEFQDDFLRNNGDHAWDVNQDGWIDVISAEWMGDEIHWYENPGAKALKKGLRWKPHLLKKTRGENEALFLRDLDDDGTPEILIDCWEDDAPLVCWKLTTEGEDKTPTLKRIELGPQGCGHGMAFGDVNGDSREDILVKVGWYERPEGDALGQPWKLHRDWDLPHGATPFIVTDLTGDGRNDLIWGDGHNYGLYWFEQGDPSGDGKTTWKRHLIDRSYSQTHTLVWINLDGENGNELITGKRVRGHAGNDPGGREPECLYYYSWDPQQREFARHDISPPGKGVGTGMQINTADLDGDGRLDLAVSGKSGTYVLFNRGKSPADGE
jgi:hypothetical protein